MCFWALSFIWYKDAYSYFTPIATVFLRLFISSVFLFLVLFILHIRPVIEKVDLKWFLLLAFFEPFIYFLGESYGMKLVTPVIGSVIIATIPVISPFSAWIFVKEKPGIYAITGIIISFIGVIMVIFHNGQLSASLTGVLLMFIAALSTVGYTVVLKRLADKYNPILVITLQNTIGVILFLPLFLLTKQYHLISNLSVHSLIPIIKLSILASTVAFIFFIYAMRNLGIILCNTFINMIPVLTAIFSYLLLGERFSMIKISGILVVIIGIMLSQFRYGKNFFNLNGS
jgi:drug/metabolite transporter (DMT)-like permease